MTKDAREEKKVFFIIPTTGQTAPQKSPALLVKKSRRQLGIGVTCQVVRIGAERIRKIDFSFCRIIRKNECTITYFPQQINRRSEKLSPVDGSLQRQSGFSSFRLECGYGMLKIDKKGLYRIHDRSF